MGALAQSGGAWLPAMFPDATLETAIAAVPEGRAVVLEAGAPPILDVLASARNAGATNGARTLTLAIGPEGGFEESELAALRAGGFRPASLGASVLRFETAAVAGIAAARAALDANR